MIQLSQHILKFLLLCLIVAGCSTDNQDPTPESTNISNSAVDSGSNTAPPTDTSMVPSATSEYIGAAATAEIQIRVQNGFYASGRPAADLEAHALRKPEQVIAWAGVTEGMEVIDIASAGGYYAENLAWAVGMEGWVIAQNTPAALERRDGANRTALEERLSGRVPQIESEELEYGEIGGGFEDLGAAYMVNSIHDLYNFQGEAATFELLDGIYNVLQPSGFFILIDHRGASETDNSQLHRIDPEVIKPLLELAGFVITDETDLLSNSEDDLSLSVFDESIRGNTDRFILKAVKPPG